MYVLSFKNNLKISIKETLVRGTYIISYHLCEIREREHMYICICAIIGRLFLKQFIRNHDLGDTRDRNLVVQKLKEMISLGTLSIF